MNGSSALKTYYRFRPLPHSADTKEDADQLQYRLTEIEQAKVGKLYFSNLRGQNDVFENSPVLSPSPDDELQKARELLTNNLTFDPAAGAIRIMPLRALRDFIEEGLHEARTTTKIVCLSQNQFSPVMWGHYAGSGTGVCFEYEIDNPNPKRGDVVALEMNYPSKRPEISECDALLMTLAAKCKQNMSMEMHSKALSTVKLLTTNKAEDWCYEKEWRLSVPFTQPLKGETASYFRVAGL